MVAIPLATEAWYRTRSTPDPNPTRWWVTYPTNLPSFRELEVAPRARDELGYDESSTGAWQTDGGIQWDAYCFRWVPREISYTFRARLNRPERCLPAAGLRLLEDAGIEHLSVGPASLPFHRFTFDADGRRLHVFFCLWEDGAIIQSGSTSKSNERFRAAWDGRRVMGQQTLEFILTGHSDLEEATRAVRETLPQLVKIIPPAEAAQQGH